MNPYYYLFYKISKLANKKGNNEWGPIFGITVLIGYNISVVYSKCININRDSYANHKPYLIILYSMLFVINSILFLNKSRVKRIMERYGKESSKNRILGGALIILYVAISIILIFIV